jgi:foldase protein PrsA
VVAAGCGGMPGNAVAEVDGEPIKKDAFEHWMLVASKASAQGQPGAQVPDPPEYTGCVAQKRKTTPSPGKGQPKPTDRQLKDQCRQEYEALRDQVLQLLVSHEWIRGEAAELGLEVSEDEVRKSYEQQKKQGFPKEEDFQKFLKDSAQTEEDLLLQVRIDMLSTKISEDVAKDEAKVTEAQIQKFYDENKERFAQPERRDLRIVLTRAKARANEAKAALESGDSWKSVAREYSIDEASKSQGGKLPAQAEGSLEQALDKAVFAADKGEVGGPVKTEFGYYVFEVDKVRPKSEQSLEQASDTIRQTLQSQNQQEALEKFSRDFQRKWRERTDCRDEYATSACKNGPDPTPTPTPAPVQPG